MRTLQLSSRCPRALSFAVLLSALAGCTLDFQDFEPYTTLPPPAPEPDLIIIIEDRGVDLELIDAEFDLAPPPDQDGDGIIDAEDNCPEVANPEQENFDGDALGDVCDDDRDGDMIEDSIDNCPLLPNAEQADLDGDGLGDLCDDDLDGDLRPDLMEPSFGQVVGRSDSDGDGFLDGEDPCPGLTDWTDSDLDGDGLPSACDADDDGDGVLDWKDRCPGHPDPEQAPAPEGDRGVACVDDYDGDGLLDGEDPCPLVPGPAARCGRAAVGARHLFEGDVYSVRATAEEVAVGSSGALLLLDGEGNRRESLGDADGLEAIKIEKIAHSPSGETWFIADGRPHQLRAPAGLESAMRLEPLPLAALSIVDGDGAPLSVLSLAVDAERVWLGTTAGLYLVDGAQASLQETGAQRPGEILDLWLAGDGRLWVLEAAGLSVLDPAAGTTTPALLPGEIGVPRKLHADEGRVWILGDLGAAEVSPENPEALERLSIGSIEQLAPRPLGLYFSDGVGLRWEESSGRQSLPQEAALPGELRALDQAGPLSWVGTAQGLLSLAGQWFQLDSRAPLSCLYEAVSVNEYLWLATSDGVQRLNPEGILDVLPETSGTPVSSLGPMTVAGQQELWVGREGSLLRFDVEKNLIATHGPDEGLPVAPLVDFSADGELFWLAFGGAQGALAWTTIASLEAGEPEWTLISPDPEGALFRSGEIRAIAPSGPSLWVATADGLCAFSLAERRVSSCFGVNDWIYLRNSNILDLSVYGDRVSVATENGIASTTDGGATWVERRRGEDAIPINAGTNIVESLADTGAGLWLKMSSSERTPNGSLVFLPESPDGFAPGELFLPEELGLPLSADGTSRLRSRGGALSLSHCAGDDSGGLMRLDGARGERLPRPTQGLSPIAPGATLVEGPEGDALWVSAAPDGAPLLQRISAEGISPMETNNLPALPRTCAWQPDTERLICLLAENQLAYYSSGSWTLNQNEVFREIDVQVVELPRREMSSPWYGSRDGLYNGSRMKFNRATSGGVLPSDDIRALFYERESNTLYVGSAAGLALYRPAENSWVEVSETLQREIIAIEEDQRGDIWVAARGELFQLVAGQVAGQWRLSDGLPEIPLLGLARAPSGVLALLTPGGLHRRSDAGFESLWRGDGLPLSQRQLVGGAALVLYGEGGILRLDPSVVPAPMPDGMNEMGVGEDMGADMGADMGGVP